MSLNDRDEQKSNKLSTTEKLKAYLKNIADFSHYDTKTIIYIVLFAFLIVISLFLLFYVYFIDKTILYRIVVEWFVNPIYYLGFFGVLLFILIMALQGKGFYIWKIKIRPFGKATLNI